MTNATTSPIIMPPKEIYVPPKPQVVVIDGQTVTANIDRRIFNYESQDINSGDMFFGQPGGLLDNSNEQHPYIEFLYEKLRGLDWNEREFDFTQCNLEFKRMNRDDPTLAKPMINQLGFQWETDTVAARLVSLIMGCFTTHETTANLYQRIGDNECLVEGSQVLTPQGWMDLSDVTTDTLVAQYDPSDGAITFVKPSRVIEKDYEGEIVYFDSHNGHVRQGVTPNHRMPVKKRSKGTFDAVLAKDIDYRKGTAADGISLPVAGYLQATAASAQVLSALERFFIACQADGSVSERYDGSLVGTVPVRFGFSKERKIERLQSIVTELGWTIKENAARPEKGNTAALRNFVVDVPADHVQFLKNFDWVDLSKISETWGKDFLNEIVQWDGHFTKNTGILHTTSRQAVEVSQSVACLVGYKTHLRFYPDNRKETFSGCWRLSWKDQDYVSGQVIRKLTGEYSGKVRCVTVPTGYFVCRFEDRVSITGNCVHARTYKEIEMFSFDDVDTIKKAILKFQANAERLETVATVFSRAHDTALDLKRGRLERNQETFDVFYLFAIALFLMERMQFICSFATTFTYDHHGHFKPICNAVTKICQDEYEIHAMAGAYIIEHLSGTSHGLMAFNRLRETIVKMFHEVLYNELRHVPLLMEGRKEIFGVTIEDYWRWARFNATFIAEHLRIPTEFTPLHKNPLSFMKKYMNINSIQQSLQEEQGKAYLLTPVRRDDYGYEFDTTGL